MKLKTKLWIAIGVLAVACLLLLINSFRVDPRVSYHKGRAEQALEDLQQAEKVFEEAVEQDKELQKEKDERIAELEVEIAKDDQVIVVQEQAVVVTRDMLIASGLYKGLVKELDEKWAANYATLESKLAKREAQLKEWQEKFDSKVNVAMRAYIEKDLAQKKVIEELQGLCKAQEKQLKRSKFWGYVGKGFTAYHAVKGGIHLAKGVL